MREFKVTKTPDPEAAQADRPGHDRQLATRRRKVQQGHGHHLLLEVRHLHDHC